MIAANRLFVFIMCVGILVLRCVQPGLGQVVNVPSVPHIAFYEALKVERVNLLPFHFKNYYTQEEVTGFRSIRPTLDIGDLESIALDSREIGSAPMLGIAIRFKPRVEKVLSELRATLKSKPQFLIEISGEPRATIRIDEISRV